MPHGDWDSASMAQLDALRAIEALTGIGTSITAWRLLRLAKVRPSTLRALHRQGWVSTTDDLIGPNSPVVLTSTGRELALDHAQRHGTYDGPRE